MAEERNVAAVRERVQASLTARNQWATDHAQRFRLLEEARLAEQGHQQRRDELDDRRKLLLLGDQQTRIDKVLESIKSKELEITNLEENLRTIPAPDEKTLRELRANRRQADSLRAQLAASALTLGVTLRQPANVRLALDGQPAQQMELPRAEKRTWSLRQRVEDQHR